MEQVKKTDAQIASCSMLHIKYMEILQWAADFGMVVKLSKSLGWTSSESTEHSVMVFIKQQGGFYSFITCWY